MRHRSGLLAGILSVSLLAISTAPTLAVAAANDDFANATIISGVPFSETVDASSATSEAGEPYPSCFAFQAPTVWYAFTPSSTITVMTGASMDGYRFALGIYTGASLDSLQEVNCGVDTVAFQAVAGTTYYIQILASVAALQVSLQAAPPPQASFHYFPANPTMFDTIQFFSDSYDAGGLGIASESWTFGDGGSSGLCCPVHQYAADGDYTVELTVVAVDGRTATTSQVVHVQTAPPPPNDDISNAIALQPLPFSVDLNTRFATASPSDPVSQCQGHPLGATAWFRYGAATSAPILLGGQADFNAFAEVYSGSPASLTWHSCFWVTGGWVRLEPTAGTTYYIVVAPSFGTNGGLLTFSADWAFTLGLTVDSAKLNTRTGAVTIGGTVTCNKPATLQELSGTLAQKGRYPVQGTFSIGGSSCDGVTRWQARVTGEGGSFVAGKAQLEVSANAYTLGGESGNAYFSGMIAITASK